MTTGLEQPAWDAVVVDAINGDRPAMDALWQEHRRWVAAVLLAHKSPQDQLEDLLQDVAMTIVGKNLPTPITPALPGSWSMTRRGASWTSPAVCQSPTGSH